MAWVSLVMETPKKFHKNKFFIWFNVVLSIVNKSRKRYNLMLILWKCEIKLIQIQIYFGAGPSSVDTLQIMAQSMNNERGETHFLSKAHAYNILVLLGG